MADCDDPIALIDSGLGGLTVARAVRNLLPAENLLYFGDTARVPYGSKSPETVTAFIRQIIRFLLPMRPKQVVIACNTASALALPTLRQEMPGVAISGVVVPGARAAIAACGAKRHPTIGIVATEATVRSRAYERAISPRRHQARLISRWTPLLVPMIEEGRDESDVLARMAVEQYVRPLVERGIDALLLGCTHYPILREAFQDTVGAGVPVIDSSGACAEDVQRRLRSAGLLRQQGQGWLHCFVTDNTQRFKALAGRFLAFAIEEPEQVPFQRLAAAGTFALARSKRVTLPVRRNAADVTMNSKT